jgi:creatinine amidohydrolase
MINEWDLASTNLHRTKARRYEVAVLPMATTEPHNFHLPYGTDTIETDYIARRCCQEAAARGASVALLPTMPYGVDCNLIGFPMVVHVSQQTLDTLAREIIASLAKSGVRKFVLLNGHGGNTFTAFVRQVQCDLDVHVFLCNWWEVAGEQYNEIFTQPDSHAGEMETSLMLAIAPDLVERQHAGDGKAKPFRFEALRQGWVKTSRAFPKLSNQCAVGNPAAASAEKGSKFIDLICSRITDFVVELSSAQMDDTFPQV